MGLENLNLPEKGAPFSRAASGRIIRPALTALGFHVMPHAVMRPAPRVMAALTGIVHSCESTPGRDKHQHCQMIAMGVFILASPCLDPDPAKSNRVSDERAMNGRVLGKSVGEGIPKPHGILRGYAVSAGCT